MISIILNYVFVAFHTTFLNFFYEIKQQAASIKSAITCTENYKSVSANVQVARVDRIKAIIPVRNQQRSKSCGSTISRVEEGFYFKIDYLGKGMPGNSVLAQSHQGFQIG